VAVNDHPAPLGPGLETIEDPYAVLGIERGAGAEDVRRAYFRLVRVHTPEAHPEEFKRVRAAYEALRSPLRRAELALLAFDETVAEVDLDLVAAAGEGELDVAALLLAVELGASDLARAEFPDDRWSIPDDLFGPPLGDRPSGAP
jgi:curved DNA-binding protein CbpA